MTDLELLAEMRLEYYRQLRMCQSESANIFRQVRENNKLTQRDLANLLGCTYQYISKIENGHVASAAILVKLAAILKEIRKSDYSFGESND